MRFRQVLAAAGFSSREPEAISLANALGRRRTCVTSLRHPRNIEFFKIAAFVAPAEHHRYEGQRREAQYFTFHKQFPSPAQAHHPSPCFNARVTSKYDSVIC